MKLATCLTIGFVCTATLHAQFEVGRTAGAPTHKVDPSFPKPLPEKWVFGELGGVCIDAQDRAARPQPRRPLA